MKKVFIIILVFCVLVSGNISSITYATWIREKKSFSENN